MTSVDAVRLDRTQLYERVWAKPMRDVAAELGISDVGLAKVCDRLRVPSPPRGYWAATAAGKRWRRPALPAPREGDATDHVFRPGGRPPAPEQEREVEPIVTVATELREPHPLVAETQRVLHALLPTAEQAALLLSKDARCLDLSVSPAELDRALRILDALVKGCEQRGWRVACGAEHREERTRRWELKPWYDKSVATWIQIGDEIVCFCLEEDRRWTEVPQPPLPAPEPPAHRKQKVWLPPTPRPPKHVWRATGVLTLKLLGAWRVDGVRRRWIDGKRQRVEHCLTDFFVAVRLVATRLRADRIAEEQRQREEARRREEAADAERRRQAEQRRLDDLRQSWTGHD